MSPPPRANRPGPIGWTPESGAHSLCATIGPIALQPGWYRLSAHVDGGPALVSAHAVLQSGAPPMRLQLDRGTGDDYTRTIRVSDTIESISVTAKGAAVTGLTGVGISRLGRAGILRFLLAKGLRHLRRHGGAVNPRTALRQLWMAVRPPANLVFGGGGGFDEAAAYPTWRAIHEDPRAPDDAAARLTGLTKGRRLRIGVLIGSGLDGATAMRAIASSLAGGVTIDRVGAQDIAARPQDWDFILPHDHAGAFAMGALETMALAMLEEDGLCAVYADSDRISPTGERIDPSLKPPWDGELLSCRNYIRSPLLLRWRPDLLTALQSAAAREKPGYALALALLEQRPRSALGQVHAILFHESGPAASSQTVETIILTDHLRRTRSAARLSAPGSIPVVWPLPIRQPQVSLIIPTRDSPELLRSCIESIRAASIGMTPEIVVADNGSIRPETLSYLDEIQRDLGAKVVRCPGPFNYSAINNRARLSARGEILLLLNDDTRVLGGGWIEELAGLAARPEIGAVGALLLYPDGSIQHAGMVMGVGGVVEHAFRHWPGDSPGYLDLLRCRREVTAVTGACLAVSARHYDSVGGLEEQLPVTLNDVDFCLRLRAQGLINLWTPFARLEHLESKTRGLETSQGDMLRLARDLRFFTQRWRHLPPRDGFYHPGLSDFSADYRLAV